MGRAGHVMSVLGQKTWRAALSAERLSNVRSNKLASRPVSRVLYGLELALQTWRPFILGRRCRLPRATYPDTPAGKACPGFPEARCPYSILLPAGFAVPLALPLARWALTPPFHPYRAAARRALAGGSISVALSLGSPPPAVNRRRFSVEPGLSSLPAFRRMGNAAARPAGPALKRGRDQKGKENNVSRAYLL
jgi:hypothetical protein